MKAGLRHPSTLTPLVALCTGLALPAGALGASWLPPNDLSAAGGDAEQAQVAVDPVGNVTAVWRRFQGSGATIQVAFRSAATGIWSPPRNLSVVDPGVSLPMVAVAPDGSATVVWRRFVSSSYVIEGVTRSTSGTWSAPQVISQQGENAYEPDVAMDGLGDAFVVWRRPTGPFGSQVVQVSERPAGGSWGMPTTLSADGADAYYPQVAADASGDAVVSWRRSDGTNYLVQVASHPAAGLWTPVTTLSQPGQDAFSPTVAMGVNGDAAVVWRRSNGTNSVIQSAARSGPSGPWQATPDTISAPGQDAQWPRLGIDATGAVTVVWMRSNGTNQIVQSATRSPAGVWGSVQDLSAAGSDAIEPEVAVDPGGNAVAVWQRFDGANDVIQAAFRPSGAAWQPASTLSATGLSAQDPEVGASSNGVAASVWSRGSGGDLIVQGAVRANAGPTLTGLSVPATGVVRTPLAFSVTTAAGPFPLGGPPVWTFGDGGTASGYSVRYAYQSVGTYTVTVSQSDVEGNPVGAQRQVQIQTRGTSQGGPSVVVIRGLRVRPVRLHRRPVVRCVVRYRHDRRRRTACLKHVGTVLQFSSQRPVRLRLVVRHARGKRVIGRIAVTARKGKNRIRLTGIVARHVLAGGTYRVTLTPRTRVHLKADRFLTVRIRVVR